MPVTLLKSISGARKRLISFDWQIRFMGNGKYNGDGYWFQDFNSSSQTRLSSLNKAYFEPTGFTTRNTPTSRMYRYDYNQCWNRRWSSMVMSIPESVLMYRLSQKEAFRQKSFHADSAHPRPRETNVSRGRPVGRVLSMNLTRQICRCVPFCKGLCSKHIRLVEPDN